MHARTESLTQALLGHSGYRYTHTHIHTYKLYDTITERLIGMRKENHSKTHFNRNEDVNKIKKIIIKKTYIK